jgi:Domain of unknown function (DUF4395)
MHGTALRDWMGRNLTTQGYRLSAGERRGLWLGLRFPTGACLALVIAGVALESVPILLVASGIGLIAGFTRRHPFDLVWNHAVRHALRMPALPPNPPRRRHGFKLAAGWLLTVAGLFAAGLTTAGVVLGLAMVAACSAVTLFNLCLPSVALSLWERFRRRETVPA